MSGWPWPLNGIQTWFEDLWNWISRAAVDAVGVVSGWIWDAIGWLSSRVSEVGAWIWDQVKPLLGPVADWIEDAAVLIAQTFISFAKDPVGFISSGVNWIGTLLNEAWNSISAGVSAVGSWLGDALGEAKDTIVSGVTGLASTISSAVGGAVNTLSTAFDGAMSVLGSWVSDALAGVAAALGEALGYFVSWISEKLSWIAESIIGVANIVKDAVVGFFEMVGRSLVAMITTVFSPSSPDPQIKAEAETAFSTMVQEIETLTELPRESMPPIEALTTAVVSVAARFLMLKLGVEGIGAAVDAAHPIKGLKAHAIAAGLMAVMDMPAVIGPVLSEPIRQGIFIPWRQYWASRYTPEIPGPNDLIRFVVREVITPEDFYATMPYHGYSERWAIAYWEAHWVLPAFGQLVDAFHRGVITEGDLEKFIVWHDYSPEARPGATTSDLAIMRGVLKRLIPRVDLRRGWEYGAISDAELENRYVMLGYEDDAPLMAEIQRRVAMETEIGKLRDNAKSDFGKGYILEADLRAALETLGYGPATIEYHVQDAVQDRERKRKDALVDNYLDAYNKELIATEDELAAYLADVIVDPNLVQVIVEDAYIRRYKKPQAG